MRPCNDDFNIAVQYNLASLTEALNAASTSKKNKTPVKKLQLPEIVPESSGRQTGQTTAPFTMSTA
jgi:hypothetical protein